MWNAIQGEEQIRQLGAADTVPALRTPSRIISENENTLTLVLCERVLSHRLSPTFVRGCLAALSACAHAGAMGARAALPDPRYGHSWGGKEGRCHEHN